MHYSEKLVKIIRSNKRILIATHIDPDADGIAAALSCGYLVRHYKKRKPVLFCHSPIPSRYRFLMGGWKFSRKVPPFDVLLAVDSAGIARIFPDEYHVRAARPVVDGGKAGDRGGRLAQGGLDPVRTGQPAGGLPRLLGEQGAQPGGVGRGHARAAPEIATPHPPGHR